MTPPLTMAEQRAVEKVKARLGPGFRAQILDADLCWILERLVEDLRDAHGIKAGPA